MNRSFRSIDEMNESQCDGYYLNGTNEGMKEEEENEVRADVQMHVCNLNEKGLEDPIEDYNKKDDLSEREDEELINSQFVREDEMGDVNIDIDYDEEGESEDDEGDDVDDIDIDEGEGDDSDDIDTVDNDDDLSDHSEIHTIDTSNDDETEDSDIDNINIDTDYDDNDNLDISDTYNEDYNNVVNNHLTTFHLDNVNENANELLYNFNLHSSPSNNQHKVFIAIANEIAKFSKCQSKQVGCIVVKDGRIISSGCNGTPTGAVNCSELFTSARMNDPIYRETHHAFSEAMECHAEENAILMAARYGNSIDKSIFYVSMKPCERCLKMIANLNVKYIYYDKVYDKYVEYKDYVKDMFRDLNIHLIDINTMN